MNLLERPPKLLVLLILVLAQIRGSFKISYAREIMNIIDLVNIRTIEPQDVNFILDSSFSSLTKYLNTIFKGWTVDSLYYYMQNLIPYCVLSEDYSTFIACNSQDSNQIYAYVIANPKTNHIMFQYTKYAYRGMGIQKTLLMPLVVDMEDQVGVQYGTKNMQRWAEKKHTLIIDGFIIERIKK